MLKLGSTLATGNKISKLPIELWHMPFPVPNKHLTSRYLEINTSQTNPFPAGPESGDTANLLLPSLGINAEIKLGSNAEIKKIISLNQAKISPQTHRQQELAKP